MSLTEADPCGKISSYKPGTLVLTDWYCRFSQNPVEWQLYGVLPIAGLSYDVPYRITPLYQHKIPLDQTDPRGFLTCPDGRRLTVEHRRSRCAASQLRQGVKRGYAGRTTGENIRIIFLFSLLPNGTVPHGRSTVFLGR